MPGFPLCFLVARRLEKVTASYKGGLIPGFGRTFPSWEDSFETLDSCWLGHSIPGEEAGEVSHSSICILSR